MRRALEEPMRMIATNAGLDGAVVIEKVRMLHSDGKLTTGYDVLANDYVDMLKAGIIDPVKVTRSAVENACSIAAMILTTSALVTDIPEEKPAMPAAAAAAWAWTCNTARADDRHASCTTRGGFLGRSSSFLCAMRLRAAALVLVSWGTAAASIGGDNGWDGTEPSLSMKISGDIA